VVHPGGLGRCFVIGNGPSLAHTNLDLLENEVTFGCNRITKIYPHTKMRVKHYVRSEGMELLNFPDPNVWAEDVLYHLNDPQCHTWVNPYFRIKLAGINEGKEWHNEKPGMINWIGACAHYLTHYDQDSCPVTWHLPNFCSYGSSVTVAIQIAVSLGYGPIYLIGCDLGYKDDQPNHFTPDYEKGYEKMLRPARYANTDTIMGHIIAKRSSPVRIYNATIGGSLEVYERVDYERLFK
jgi:hypothetical protein